MKSFLFNKQVQEILEALYINPDTNKLHFDYKGKDGLSVTMGKGKGIQFEPYESNSKDFGGSRVISLYSTSNVKGVDREDIVTPIMKALKGQSTTEVNQDELKKWLKQAAHVMGKYIRDNVKPDAVLAIKSSSQLNNLFMKELANQLPGAAFIPDAIMKADINNIKIDPKATDIQRKAVERELKKAKATGSLSFKKIHSSLRPLFKGVMELNTVANNIENKNIIVIDDLMTSRSTQVQAIEVIKQYNPASITGVVLFKA